MSKKALETRWGRVPAEELPLRPTLLKVGDETRARVIDYMLRQAAGNPAVLQWVLRRVVEYWMAHEYPQDMVATESLHQRIDSTVAVELLVWQADVKGPKEAVEWLAMVSQLEGGPVKPAAAKEGVEA
jgi:hypothetical protein